MPPAPEALVLMLDAAVTNDDALMRCLLRRFPLMAKRAADLTNDEYLSIFQPYTNHFCLGAGTYWLIIDDRATTRTLVQECELNEHVFWGRNTDPVEFATIADVIDTMHKTSPKDSLLALLDSASADDDEPDARTHEKPMHKKPRPRAATVKADDLATADRLTSIACLLKSLQLWPEDVVHDAINPMTAEMSERIAKVRDVEVLSAFITDYIDDFDADKLRTFVSGILLQERLIKEAYKFPDGDQGPLDYWEKAYAAASSTAWAKLLAEDVAKGNFPEGSKWRAEAGAALQKEAES